MELPRFTTLLNTIVSQPLDGYSQFLIKQSQISTLGSSMLSNKENSISISFLKPLLGNNFPIQGSFCACNQTMRRHYNVASNHRLNLIFAFILKFWLCFKCILWKVQPSTPWSIEYNGFHDEATMPTISQIGVQDYSKGNGWILLKFVTYFEELCAYLDHQHDELPWWSHIVELIIMYIMFG